MEPLDDSQHQPMPSSNRREHGVVQRVIETLLLSTLMGTFTIGSTLWSRSSDHGNAILRLADDQVRSTKLIGSELLELREYIKTVEMYLGQVKERQRDIELELKVNTANDRNARKEHR